MEELRQIALDLLDAYRESEKGVIYEYSVHVDEELAELEREVAELRERIINIS